MWWSEALDRRRFLAALLPLGLAACGFRPLYGGKAGEAVAGELAAIRVVTPETRLGQQLKNQILDDLDPAGRRGPARYRLDVRLEQVKKALAIQLDDSITRYDLSLAAFFSLHALDAEDEAEPLYRSAVRRVASYNVIREPFATLMAEQDAERRAAVEVSRQIRTLLTFYFEENGRDGSVS